MKKLCPYCNKRPISKRIDAKTCGNKKCSRLYNNKYNRDMYSENRNKIVAKQKEKRVFKRDLEIYFRKYLNEKMKPLCPICLKRYINVHLLSKICTHPSCVIKNRNIRIKKYVLINKKKVKLYKQKYYLQNKKRCDRLSKIWRQKNPDKTRKYNIIHNEKQRLKRRKNESKNLS